MDISFVVETNPLVQSMAIYSFLEVIAKHNVGTNGGACPLRSRGSMFTHFGGILKKPA